MKNNQSRKEKQKRKPTKTRQQPPRVTLKIIFQNTIKTIKKDKEINTEMKTFQMKTKTIGKSAGEKRGEVSTKRAVKNLLIAIYQLHSNELDKLEEMGKFLEAWAEGEMENCLMVIKFHLCEMNTF